MTPERSRPTVTPDKGIDESESAGKHPAETLTPPDKESVVKPADKKAGSKAKAFSGRAEEDRPWIIKTGKEHKPDIPKKKERPLKWANEAQQVKCDTYLTELRKSLGKARTSSVRGDTCATAKHAKLFLDKADQCKKECPDGFLESKGYSEKVMQNVSVLLELGKKACLGATNSTRTQKTDTRKD
ncbi:MAG: hypothetical protein K9L83_10600 [Deltaproteobacteria bacterium]|nr:hypothetical protein [Deltaproteobacteria bacterium]